MFIEYLKWNPRGGSDKIVARANQILQEYSEQGYVLTLRQLYYQFVARDWLPNTQASYDKLGKIVCRARMAGLISWTAIEDRNREHHDFWYEEDVTVPVNQLPNYIRFNRWARQDHYVEVWVEKEALGNVISRACRPYCVPYMACKGYLSASEAWRAGERYLEQLNAGKTCHLIHLGDHDPSGIDMTRDNDDRLHMFTRYNDVEVHRIALNKDQVRQYSPPPNPAKITDSRAKQYIKLHGETSWELDALEPRVLEKLIHANIEQFIDWERWNEVGRMEAKAERTLKGVGENWDKVQQAIAGTLIEPDLFEQALDRIGDMLNDPDEYSHKEARKFLNRHRQ